MTASFATQLTLPVSCGKKTLILGGMGDRVPRNSAIGDFSPRGIVVAVRDFADLVAWQLGPMFEVALDRHEQRNEPTGRGGGTLPAATAAAGGFA